MVTTKFDLAFRIAASLFLIAALYHLVGVFFPGVVIPSPRWRHGVFVMINSAGIWLILRRPFWVVYPLAVVTLHQLYSHSHRAWKWWGISHRIDWISLIVVVVLPMILGLVILEAQERRNKKNNLIRLGSVGCNRPD